MRQTFYFLIEPKPVLLGRLPKSSKCCLQNLSDPILWSGERYDKSPLLTDEMAVMVKLLFLDEIRRDRSIDEVFPEVFPGFVASEKYFDDLWTVRCLTLDYTMREAIGDAVAGGTIQSLISSASDNVKTMLSVYAGQPVS